MSELHIYCTTFESLPYYWIRLKISRKNKITITINLQWLWGKKMSELNFIYILKTLFIKVNQFNLSKNSLLFPRSGLNIHWFSINQKNIFLFSLNGKCFTTENLFFYNWMVTYMQLYYLNKNFDNIVWNIFCYFLYLLSLFL